MKNIILFLFAILVSCNNLTETESKKTNETLLDTIENKQIVSKNKPYISLINTDCLEKDTFQIFKINNVENLDFLLPELHGAAGTIVTPKNPIGKGEFKIKVSKDTKNEFITIIVTDYGKSNEEVNNGVANPEKPRVIIDQKIRICN
jgi:hypothetical protein